MVVVGGAPTGPGFGTCGGGGVCFALEHINKIENESSIVLTGPLAEQQRPVSSVVGHWDRRDCHQWEG